MIEHGAPRADRVANVRTRANSDGATSPATVVAVEGWRRLAASNGARELHATRVKARDAPRRGAPLAERRRRTSKSFASTRKNGSGVKRGG